MKLQDVILRAIAKKITWLDAADIAGVSALTIGRMREKYETFGYDGLFEQQRHRRLVHRVPLETAETVLALYQQKYSGLSTHRFHQKLRTDHDIHLPYSWVRQALLGAGLVAVERKPPMPARNLLPAHPRRPVFHFVRSASFR